MPKAEFVLKTAHDSKVPLVRLLFSDVLGQLKSVAIAPVDLDQALTDGVRFDGTAIDGFTRVHEADVVAVPDAHSFELVRDDRGEAREAVMFCDIQNLDGAPFEGDPRQVLRRTVTRLHRLGFTAQCAPEVEFFYLDAALVPDIARPLDVASYFDLTSWDTASDIRSGTISRLEALSIPVELSFHEDGPSQHEIDLRPADLLGTADNLMSLRLIVREVAMAHGVHATFMPKPIPDVQGSGMHTRFALYKDDENALADPGAPHGLSQLGRSFIAGILRYAREFTAVTNQLINSYKRLVPGFEAPTVVAWAQNNRQAMLRVVPTRITTPDDLWVEHRALDPACNPYLALAVILSAGIKGIEDELDLDSEPLASSVDAAALRLADASARSRGTPTDTQAPELLPQSLSDALYLTEASEFARETLGPHIFEWFCRNKRAEWQQYTSQISAFERERYLRTW